MGRPVSGVSLAFLTASWNFFSSRSPACFWASTDCRKMESRRLSCSFMARAASSMSLKVLGLTAAVWAITASFSESTFSTALQHGQVTSNAEALPFIPAIILQNESSTEMKLDGKNLEYAEQFPAQHHDRNQNHGDSNGFAEAKAIAVPFGRESTGNQAKNIQGRKTEYQHEKNVVNLALLIGGGKNEET